jgi:DNA transformation protein and related proteins
MSTHSSTIEFITDQLSSLLDVTSRPMFGEYALYLGVKVIGLVCNDILYIKITEAGREFVGENYKEGIAYPGARPSLEIDGDLIEDRQWLCELVTLTADCLPVPKPKKLKK